MIKQMYDYKFFVDNYPYRYDSIFRKYYKQQEKKYRYHIKVNRDINSHVDFEMFRSNESLDIILSKLKDIAFQVTRIVDFRSEFPEPREYVYNKFEDEEWVTEEYYLRDNFIGNRDKSTDKFFYKVWYSKYRNEKCLIDEDMIQIVYKSIEVKKYRNEKIKASIFTLYPSREIKYDFTVTDKLEKIVEKIKRDNINGFYDDMLERIKNDFGLRC